MARRPNYGFEKRQKELKRQEKKEAKEERKRQRRDDGTLEEASAGDDAGEAPDDEQA